jgi:ribose/xylose/arabinose/galactoside ABC-type transport system permease subunit
MSVQVLRSPRSVTRFIRMPGIGAMRSAGLLLAIVIELVILQIKDPGYLSIDNLQLVGVQITEVGIVAVGMTFLMISGNVDLSVGSMTGLVATASALMSTSLPMPLPIIFGILVGLACGTFNGALVWRFAISPIIITIGSLSLLYGIALVLNQGEDVPNVPGAFTSLGQTDIAGFSIGFVVFVVLSVLCWVFLRFTVTGRRIYAIGGNPEAAARVGIPVRRYIIGAFMVTGLLVGVGGVLLASRFGTASADFGVGLEVQVITAVILGGVSFNGGEGSMVGAFLAVVFLGVLESGIVAVGINPYYADVVEGAALIIAVALDQIVQERRAARRRTVALADLAEATATVPKPSAEPDDVTVGSSTP